LACGNFTSYVEEAWPVAYAEQHEGCEILVELGDHLKRVACLNQCLFNDRISVLVRRRNEEETAEDINIQVSESDVHDLLYAAGLLHDVGKASPLYLSLYKDKVRIDDICELKFPYHEYVGSILLILSVRKNNALCPEDEERAKLLATIIARHHAAMRGRHPYSLLNKSKKHEHEIIAKAIRSLLDDSRVYNKLSGILEDGRNRLGGESWARIVDALIDGRNCIERDSVDRSVVEDEIQRLAITKKHRSSNQYMILVKSLSGALIVSDIIEASLVRSKCADSERAYVSYWLSELSHKEKCFKECGLTDAVLISD